MANKQDSLWIDITKLKGTGATKKGKSIYAQVQEILKTNKDKAYTRSGLVSLINPKAEGKEFSGYYWAIANALDFLADDGFIVCKDKTNPAYYFWKE